MVAESGWEIEGLVSKDQEEEACLGKRIKITQKKSGKTSLNVAEFGHNEGQSSH